MYRLIMLFINLAVLGLIIFMTIKETPNGGEQIAIVTSIYFSDTQYHVYNFF